MKNKEGVCNREELQYIIDCYKKFELDITMYKNTLVVTNNDIEQAAPLV